MVKKLNDGEYYGVDWDGTCVEYHGWTKWNEFGKPIPKMVERVRGWLADGDEVRIITARVSHDDNVKGTCKKSGETFTNVQMKHAIASECERIFGQRLRVQAYKCYRMAELWDDRAVGLVANTGETLVDAALAEAVARQGKAFPLQEDPRD